MSDRSRPAWAHDSLAVRLAKPAPVRDFTPEVAFAGSTGAGVRVAVIDSGIDSDHPMLGSCVDRDAAVEFTVSPDGEVIKNDGPHDDAFGHGTAVAGIIHALAPEASITSVRVLGPNLTGKAAAFHAGLVWAVDEGYDIVNLSLGTTRSEWALAFHEVCDRAYFGNTFIVTAANNVQRASYPSLFASVASVACNTSTDPLRFHANPNPPTEFLARGIDIEVPWINGGTTTITGNSFAAPHIAGLATLVKAKHPELRPFQLKAALWATSANVLEASPVEPAGRRTTMFVGGAVERNAHTISDGPIGYRLRGAGSPTRWGTLWEAERSSDARPVTIHQIDPTERDPASASTELRTMMSTVAAIGHPGIAPVVEVVDRPWLGVVGERRRPLIDTSEAVAPAAAIDLVEKICDVLGAAHEAGVVHGALAASSLSPDSEHGLIVHDLGLAATLESPSPTSASAMDPRQLGHLAPEQLEGKPATIASDVYAVGVLLHRLLVGRPPYADGHALGKYLRERLTTSPASLVTVDVNLPTNLALLVDRCLSLDPTERPATMADVAAALAGTSDPGEHEEVRAVEVIPPDLDHSHLPAPADDDTPAKGRRWRLSRGSRPGRDE
ncbi:MAG: S8 family serine peptidase [Acidimicrobiales bacterium]